MSATFPRCEWRGGYSFFQKDSPTRDLVDLVEFLRLQKNLESGDLGDLFGLLNSSEPEKRDKINIVSNCVGGGKRKRRIGRLEVVGFSSSSRL